MSLSKPYLPQEVDNLTLAFPASVEDLMPEHNDIPKEFRDWNSRNKWLKFQEHWFFYGLNEDFETYPKAGIDPEKAFRHLKTIQGSYQPKHEHKAAAVAFLASLWFEGYKKL